MPACPQATSALPRGQQATVGDAVRAAAGAAAAAEASARTTGTGHGTVGTLKRRTSAGAVLRCRLVVSHDGASVYILHANADISRLDTATGQVTRLHGNWMSMEHA